MDTQCPLRILALDGGGVRGLSEVLILKFLMLRLRHEEQKKTKQRLPDLPSPWKYFDLICGTSTGGLLALIMLGRQGNVFFLVREMVASPDQTRAGIRWFLSGVS